MSAVDKILNILLLVIYYLGIAVINGLVFVVANEYLEFGWAVFFTILSMAFIYTLQDIEDE